MWRVRSWASASNSGQGDRGAAMTKGVKGPAPIGLTNSRQIKTLGCWGVNVAEGRAPSSAKGKVWQASLSLRRDRGVDIGRARDRDNAACCETGFPFAAKVDPCEKRSSLRVFCHSKVSYPTVPSRPELVETGCRQRLPDQPEQQASSTS